MPTWIEEMPDGTRRFHIDQDTLEAASMLDYDGAPELTDEEFAELTEEMRPDQADMTGPLMRGNYDGPTFGLGKVNDRRAFSALVCLADLGMLKVDDDTGLGWIVLAQATKDLLILCPKARQNQPWRNGNDDPT